MTKKTIDGLTGLRGYAALWVMFFHCWGIVMSHIGIHEPIKHLVARIGLDISPLFRGGTGVDIFFVLSGFLLFLPFAEKLLQPEKQIDIKGYFRRRFLRIFPAYYVQMVILLILGSYGLYKAYPASNWIAHSLMIHNFSREWTDNINGVWWTLPVEFHFYLLLPLCFLAINRIGIAWFVLTAALVALAYKVILFCFIGAEDTSYKLWLFGQLPGRIHMFAYGMIGAFLYKKYCEEKITGNTDGAGAILALAGITGIWLMLTVMGDITGAKVWRGHPVLYVHDSIVGLFILMVVMGVCLGGKIIRLLFANRASLYFGNISYGIYLWHFPIAIMLFDNPKVAAHVKGTENYGNVGIITAVMLILIVLIADLSYRFIEQPCMRFRTYKAQPQPCVYELAQ